MLEKVTIILYSHIVLSYFLSLDAYFLARIVVVAAVQEDIRRDRIWIVELVARKGYSHVISDASSDKRVG